MKNLYIRRLDTREIVSTIPITRESQVERTMMGLLRNMDTNNFFVDDSEFDEPGKEE